MVGAGMTVAPGETTLSILLTFPFIISDEKIIQNDEKIIRSDEKNKGRISLKTGDSHREINF